MLYIEQSILYMRYISEEKCLWQFASLSRITLSVKRPLGFVPKQVPTHFITASLNPVP